MDGRRIGSAFRALRRRRGWSQAETGVRAGLSRQAISRAERGAIDGMTLDALERCAGALGARLHLDVEWRGAGLSRLLDARHAALQEHFHNQLVSAGWVVRTEVSFSHFGERGRYDLLGWHAVAQTALVVEIKWHPSRIIPALVISDTRTAYRRVAEHRGLFSRLGLRGTAARAWLRNPTRATPTGVLVFLRLPDAPQGGSGRPR